MSESETSKVEQVATEGQEPPAPDAAAETQEPAPETAPEAETTPEAPEEWEVPADAGLPDPAGQPDDVAPLVEGS